jgi:nucleotide-binding universal stress UspA family protein
LHPPDPDEKFSYAGQVVVGVDAAGSSNPALWAAAELAVRQASPLRILSARAPFYRDSLWLDNAAGAQRFREEVTAELDAALAEVQGRFPELDASWNFYLTKPAQVLIHATRTAALMVLGTRGHGGFPGLLLGSVSQAVLHHGMCPMMVVPKGVEV